MISSTALIRRGMGRRLPPVAATTDCSTFQSVTTCSNNLVIASTSKPPMTITHRHKSSRPNQAPASNSLLGSAAEYYSSLRWKFATSLTESLSKEEQKALLGRLDLEDATKAEEANGSQNNDNHDNFNSKSQQETQHSIAEAVAAARAEEAQKQKSKWEQEKANLLQEAEAAAKARVENELLIQHRQLAFERWQEDLKREEEAQNKNQKENENQKESEKENEKVEVADGVNIADDVQLPSKEEPISLTDHPVLGSAICDLGYKRVHVASVAALKSLPVWKKQRTYRHKRAKDMAQDKLKTMNLGIPGIIALHEDVDGKLSIIDGQHRVGMLAILEEKEKEGDSSLDFDRILVEVFPESSHGGDNSDASFHAQDIFLEINKAEPVKLVDLPGISLTKADRKTINEGAGRLEEAFPAMFSSSQRCRAPHLNLDNLRDALFASDVVKRHGLKSPKALEAWILEQNQKLKNEYISDSSAKAKSISKSALQKAIKHDFFLGLDSSWLYA